MARNIIENIPPYLQEFEDIKAILAALNGVSASVLGEGNHMTNNLWFDNVVSERWGNLIKSTIYMDTLKKIAPNLITKRRVVTINELSDYLRVWLKEGKFVLEYDRLQADLNLPVLLYP